MKPRTIVLLHRIDQSRLGGPMGTETTSRTDTQAFTTVTFAKAYAEARKESRKVKGERADWQRQSGGWYWDTGGTVGWEIETVHVNYWRKR